MTRLSIIIITSLLLCGCSNSEQLPTNSTGIIPNCDAIDKSKETSEKLYMTCIDNSQEINYYSIKGPVIINVWASWCKVCKEELPYFVHLYANPIFKGGEVKLLGISVDEKNSESAINLIKSLNMSWPHLKDLDGRSKLIFGPGVPVTYFLDIRGEIVYKHLGAYLSKKQLYDDVEKYFKVKL